MGATTMSSYRYCRVPAISCSAQFVLNRLAGQPLHSLPGGRTVVPLLHPQKHGLPFALTLELHSSQQPTAVAAPPPAALDRSLYALHYVLAGSGQLARQGGSEQLQAGDSVLMHLGAAACGAGDSGDSGDAAAAVVDPHFQLADIVAYMPRQLFEDQQQQQQGREQQQEQLAEHMLRSASLQPLLHPSSSGGGGEAGLLSEALVASLLLGARETAKQALQGAALPAQRQLAAAAKQASVVRQQLPPVLKATLNSLNAWWQQMQQRSCPVTKRTLADLTTFQLPNQTNRLAIQFDPFSRPQVPFISGLEVFEPGHCTTPHVHPQAHELFVILSGSGTGFCGEERFPVTAGDVVVFRPGSVHGIDNSEGGRMYCLELMLPNEQFAEYVRTGTDTGSLEADDMCVLAAIGCR